MFKDHPEFYEVCVQPEFDLVTTHHQAIWRKGDRSHMLIRPAQRFEGENQSISRYVIFSVIDNPEVLCGMPIHQILRGEGEGDSLKSLKLGINPLAGDVPLADSLEGEGALSKLRRLPRYSLNAGQLYHLDTSIKLDAYRALLKSNIDLATLGHISDETKNSPYFVQGISHPDPAYVAYLSHLHSQGALSGSIHLSSEAERKHRDKVSSDYLAKCFG